jgi:hypothetical protein
MSHYPSRTHPGPVVDRELFRQEPSRRSYDLISHCKTSVGHLQTPRPATDGKDFLRTVEQSEVGNRTQREREGQEKPNGRTLRAQSKDQGSELTKLATSLPTKGREHSRRATDRKDLTETILLNPLLCNDLSGKGDAT